MSLLCQRFPIRSAINATISIISAAAAIHLIAFGEVTEGVDMGAHMDGHFYPFQIGASVIFRPHLSAALDAVGGGRT